MLIGAFAVSSLFAYPWVRGFDVVWTASWAPGVVYSRLDSKPCVFNLDDLTIEDVTDMGLAKKNSLFIKVAETIYRLFYVQCDAITPISPGYIKTVLNKYCVKEDKIHLVRGGVDLALFENISHPANKDKKDKFLVLYVGVLGVGYDYDQILGAAKILETKDSKVRFLLHGGGEMAGIVKKQIQDANLTNVEFSDHIFKDRRDVASLMNEADALILPMRDFGRPYLGIATKLYEYQAAGKPIICCGRLDGEPMKYIKLTESGIPVKIGDCEGIARAVLFLKDNPEIARQLGENGRRYVEENISIEAIGLEMKTIFNIILNKVDID